MKKPAHLAECAGFDLVPERGIEPPTFSLRMIGNACLRLLTDVDTLNINQQLTDKQLTECTVPVLTGIRENLVIQSVKSL